MHTELYLLQSKFLIATDQFSGQKAYSTSAGNKFGESGVYQMHNDDQRDLEDRKRYLEYGW